MVALCVAAADIGESSDFSLPPAGDPPGVPRRELFRHGPPGVHADLVQVFV